METPFRARGRTADVRRYSTGSWFALSGEGAVALLPPSAGVASLQVLSGALNEGGIGAFIEALALATGNSVTSLPDFGVAVIQADGMRVAVRGSVSASDSGTDAPPLSGAGVTGWAEVVWPSDADVALTASGAAGDGAALDLWVGTGVVLASAVWINATGMSTQPHAVKTSVATSQIRAVAPEQALSTLAAAPLPPLPPLPPPLLPPPPLPPLPPPLPLPAAAVDPAAAVGAVPADAGDTLAAPVDEADVDDNEFGIWGSTVAGVPPRAPLIDAVPDPADLPAALTLPEPTSAPQAQSSEQAQPASPMVELAGPFGDHDGATISVAALREMQANSAPPSFASVEDLARERRGRAVLSTGAVVTLDRNIIVGRTPKATRITGEMPHLVAVPSPQQDISRNHLEIRVTDTVVVAIDLDTTNGSVLHRQGAEPMRLHPGELNVVVSHDVIDLGDGVTITFEDLP